MYVHMANHQKQSTVLHSPTIIALVLYYKPVQKASVI